MYRPTERDRIEAIEEALQLLNLTKTTKQAECPYCHGTGKQYYSVGHNSHKESSCYHCSGKGYIEKPIYIKE